MTRTQKAAFYLGFLLMVGTGIPLAIILYWIKPDDPFAVVNHPLQPLIQHLHILFAPVLVFGMGWIWQDHVLGNIRRKVKPAKISGWTCAILFPLMALSGYSFQITSAEPWQSIWKWTHLGSGLAWTMAAAIHVQRPLRKKRKKAK